MNVHFPQRILPLLLAFFSKNVAHAALSQSDEENYLGECDWYREGLSRILSNVGL